MARDAVLKAHASSASVRSNDLLAPRADSRGANKSGERNRRDAQLRVTAARSAAVTTEISGGCKPSAEVNCYIVYFPLI
jgi:hypothetical protein